MKHKLLAGHAAACMTILIWGTTFISTKVLLQSFSPIEILLIRFVIGYAALWIALPHPLRLKEKRQEVYFAAAGLCGVSLYYLLENIALTYTLASNVGVMISIAPFFTVIFSGLFLHTQRPTVRFFGGFVIAMAGIALIGFGNGGVVRVNPLGDLLAVIAAITWAAYSTLSKKISAFGYNTIQTTRRTFFYGLVFLLPTLLFWQVRIETAAFLDPAILLNCLFLGLGASAVCFVTWNLAVERLGAVRTSVYIYLVPVITTVTAAFVLHETITFRMVCGITLTLIGLFLSEDRRQERAEPA